MSISAESKKEAQQVRHEFGFRLMKARRAMHITQKQLGEKIGCCQRMIGYYEEGKHYPQKKRIEELAKALRVSMAWLEYETGPVFPKIGRWYTRQNQESGYLYCDICKHRSGITRRYLHDNGDIEPRYCPWCGAKMMMEERRDA